MGVGRLGKEMGEWRLAAGSGEGKYGEEDTAGLTALSLGKGVWSLLKELPTGAQANVYMCKISPSSLPVSPSGRPQ